MNTAKNILHRDWHPYQDGNGAYNGPGICFIKLSSPKPRGPSDEQKANWAAQARLADRQAEIAEKTYRLGREQWRMYRKHYNKFVLPRAKEGLEQLRNLNKRVEEWASPGRINMEEGQAAMRARASFDSAKKGLANTLNRFGGNMGRFTGAMRQLTLGSASAQAGARNTARQGILDRDLTNRFNLANMWQGAPAPLSGMNTIRSAQQGLGSAAGALGNVGGQMTSHWNNANAAAAQQAGGLWGGLGSLAGNLGAAWILTSDRRLKTDIKKIDVLPNDINLYEYRYIGSDILYTGVMADELERVKPHLVGRHRDILFVDYRKLIDELIADAMSEQIVQKVAKGMKPLAEAC